MAIEERIGSKYSTAIPKTISKEQLSNIVSSITDTRDILIVNILYHTGLNLNELSTLKISDINIKEKKIRIRAENTKNRSSRDVLLGKDLLITLKRSLKIIKPEQEFLLSTRQSKKISNRRIEQILKDYGKRNEIELTPSVLRDTYIQNSFSSGIKKEKIQTAIGTRTVRYKQFIQESDLKQLLSSIVSKRDKLILHTLYETGCTVNEFVNLKKKDLIADENKIIIRKDNTKSKKTRIVKISKTLCRKLLKITHPADAKSYIFFTRQSKHISPRRIQQIFKRYLIKAGLPSYLTPQNIRYSSIISKFKLGVPSNIISDISGIKVIRAKSFQPSFVVKSFAEAESQEPEDRREIDKNTKEVKRGRSKQKMGRKRTKRQQKQDGSKKETKES